jgi:hypothetical protein
LGEENDSMHAAGFVPSTDQRPVAALGWALALAGGAGLWLLMLAPYIG